MDEPEREADALEALQKARYVAGRDITDARMVGDILREAGFVDAAALLKARNAELLSVNFSRVATGRSMMREVGGSGVPTLVLVDGATRRLFDSKLLYGPAANLLALFQAALASG